MWHLSQVPPNRLDLDDDLYNQAQSMYPEFDRDTMPGTELQDDDHFGEPMIPSLQCAMK